MSATAPQPAPAEVILSVDDIHTYYGTIHALKGISIEVRANEIVTLIGANGAGKSTTLRSDQRAQPPAQGTHSFPGPGHHARGSAQRRQDGHLAVA